MANSEDLFSIDIVLRHRWRSAESIVASLGTSVQPSIAVSGVDGKSSFVVVTLQAADETESYEDALTNVAAILEEQHSYWREFVLSGGEVVLVLNETILPSEEAGDKCMELELAPTFLGKLFSIGISLRVQAWQGEPVA